MSQQIRITPQELYDGAATIMKLAEEATNNLTQLKNLVDQVAGNWEGAAKSGYVTSFEEIHSQFVQSLPPTVEGLAEQMKAAGQAIEQTDAEIANNFR